MAGKYPLDKLSDDRIKTVLDILELKIGDKRKKYGQQKTIEYYSIKEGMIYFPFYFYKSLFDTKPNRDLTFEKRGLVFKGTLREAQEKIKSELIKKLNIHGTALLSGHPGFGKTAMAIYISCKVRLVTLVISHRVVIANQWVSSFERFTEKVKVKLLKSKDVYDPSVDVYIANPTIIPKLDPEILQKTGFLIVDEAHCFCSPVYSMVMFHFCPKFLLGLTATPDEHTDGSGVILEHLYSPKEHWIRKPLLAPHHVYRYSTGFVPEHTLDRFGKIVWDSILKSQCENEERNQEIIDIIQKFNKRQILVLCKRKAQAKYLLQELKDLKESCDIFIASQKVVNYDCRVLITTYSKGGIGFDHPSLDMLIIASDVDSYIGQYHGRIFRKTENKKLPLIVDLVDKFGVLETHWRSRRSYYVSTGGKIFLTNKEKLFKE